METIHKTAASAAKAIRGELKAKFPGVKFSVRSHTFAGGNSINISWTDGPTDKAVAAITGKYSTGHFDGMTDSYNYDPTHVVCEDGTIACLGGAKYVCTSREFSDEARNACKAAAAAYYGDWDNTPICDRETQVWRLLSRSDLRGGIPSTIRFSEERNESVFA